MLASKWSFFLDVIFFAFARVCFKKQQKKTHDILWLRCDTTLIRSASTCWDIYWVCTLCFVIGICKHIEIGIWDDFSMASYFIGFPANRVVVFFSVISSRPIDGEKGSHFRKISFKVIICNKIFNRKHLRLKT